MKKRFTFLLLFISINTFLSAQVYIDETFDTEIPSDWTVTSESDEFPWFWTEDYNSNTIDGSSGFVMVDSDDAGSGAIDLVENLETPNFDASAGNIIVVSFDQYFNQLGNDEISVEVWNGSEWTVAFAYTGPTDIGAWSPNEVHSTLIITDYINPSGDSKVRFRYIDGGSWAWWWAIDNVVVESVDCLEPLALAATQIGAVSAQVEWSSGSGASNIAFGPAGFDISDIVGTGGTLVNNVTSPYLIESLSPETEYEFYVQDDCGDDGISGWSGPSSFTTTVGCPNPVFNGFSNPSGTSIDINFTQGVGDVYVIYGEENFILGNSGDTTGVALSAYTLSGLDPLSFYDVYLFMDCNGDGLGYSDAVGPYTFNTLVDGPGTDCLNPIILNGNLPYTVAEQSICGYGNNITSGACGYYQGYEEIVFAFSPEEDSVTLGIYGSNSTTESSIYFEISSLCPDESGATCVASGILPWNGDNYLLSADLENGETYYITISGYTGIGCTFDLSIFIIECVSPSDLTSDAGIDGTELSWTSTSGAALYQVEWGLEGFSYGSGTTIDGEYGIDGPPIIIDGLSDNESYEFYVTDICGAGTESIPAGPMVFTGPPPGNDLCADAYEIVCGDEISGNTSGATMQDNPEFCGTSVTAPGIWYTFTGTGDGIELSLCGSDYDTKIHLFSGDCENLVCIDGNDDSFTQCGNTNSYLYANTEEGVTYYVFVSGWSSNVGTFNLAYNCFTCALITGLSASYTDVSASINWSTANSGAEYNLEYGLAGFTPGNGTTLTGTVGTDGPPVDITGLTAGTEYDVYVYEICSVGDENSIETVSFTTNLLPPPSNDNACNAVELIDGEILETTNSNASVQAGEPVPAATGCGSTTGWCNSNLTSSTWYMYTPPSDGIVTVSTCHEGSYDTQLAVYSADDCADFDSYVFVGANDDAIGGCSDATFASTISMCAEEGTTYYIQVDPYGTAGQDFLISVDFEEAAISNLGAFASSGNASVNFDYSGLDGTDFVIYYTNTETNEVDTVSGNTADLPIIILGTDNDVSYEFYVVCGDACGTTSETSTFIYLTGIDELAFGSNVSVFPNPVNDKLTLEIRSEVEKGTSISILSIQGKLIYQDIIVTESSDYRKEFDVSNYARGMYVLKIENGRSSIQERIIVQ